MPVHMLVTLGKLAATSSRQTYVVSSWDLQLTCSQNWYWLYYFSSKISQYLHTFKKKITQYPLRNPLWALQWLPHLDFLTLFKTTHTHTHPKYKIWSAIHKIHTYKPSHFLLFDLKVFKPSNYHFPEQGVTLSLPSTSLSPSCLTANLVYSLCEWLACLNSSV